MVKLKSDTVERKYWDIGRIARELGIDLMTIRYWEKRGLIRPVKKRSRNKIFKVRRYDRENYERIITIHSLRNYGIALKLIHKAFEGSYAMDLLAYLKKKKDEAERKEKRTMYPYFGM